MQIRYYWYSKTVMNKVVRHAVEAEPITEWLYMHKQNVDQNGNTDVDFYLYYPSINNGIYLTSRKIWRGDDSFISTMQIENERFSSPDGFISAMDTAVANNQWVGNAEIEFVSQFNTEKANAYSAYRLAYLEKQDIKHAEQEAQRKAKREAEEAAAKQKKQDLIDNFLSMVKNGGKVNNANSVLIDVCNQFNVDIPIKLKGWVYKSLASITFANGEAISCASYGSKSTTIFKYLKTLTNRIKETENEPDEIITGDLKHLFGLDKK